jgi:hypothetical protein
MEIHLIQRLLHMLTMLDRHVDQIVSMAEETTELAEGLRRPQRRRQQPLRMPFLAPPTLAAIRFRTLRDIFDVAGIDESNLKAAGLEDVKQGHPVHSGGFHHDGGNPTGRSPVSEPMQITGNRAKFLDRLDIPIRRYTHPMLLSPHIDAGGMRVEEGHIVGRRGVLLAFLGHTFLQSSEERAEHGKTGLLLRKDTLGGGALRVGYCFILIEPRRSVGGTLTSGCKRRPEASAALPLAGAAEPQRSAAKKKYSQSSAPASLRPLDWARLIAGVRP